MIGTDLLTTRMVCARLNIHRTTLDRWIARGEFPAPPVRIVDRHYWPREVVDKWIEARVDPKAADEAGAEDRERA